MKIPGWGISLALHLTLVAGGLVVATLWRQNLQSSPPLLVSLNFPAGEQSAHKTAAPQPQAQENTSPASEVPPPAKKGTDLNAGASDSGETNLSPSALAQAATGPVPLHDLQVDYPRQARRNGWEGKVEVEALINTEGRCLSARVTQSAGHEVLDQAVLKTVKEALFQAAREGQTPVEGTLRWSFEFKLTD